MAYVAPAKGQLDPWGANAKFGGGLGANNDNAFDINKGYSGLWAAGYDIRDPDVVNKLRASYAGTGGNAAGFNEKIGSFRSNNPNVAAGTHAGSLSTTLGRSISPEDAAFLSETNWYNADLARRMDKSNNFLDSTLGKILSAGLKVGLGFIPGVGPLLSAGLGAYTGQRTGGVLGGILGGLSGYGSGQLGASLATHGIKGTITNTIDSVRNLVNPGSAAGVVNTTGLPGGQTGITTPTGGGLVGSGQLNPAGVGVLGNTAAGGVAAGFNPLAVAGGAVAANVFPQFANLGQVQPLQSGPQPGTNTIVGPGSVAGQNNGITAGALVNAGANVAPIVLTALDAGGAGGRPPRQDNTTTTPTDVTGKPITEGPNSGGKPSGPVVGPEQTISAGALGKARLRQKRVIGA